MSTILLMQEILLVFSICMDKLPKDNLTKSGIVKHSHELIQSANQVLPKLVYTEINLTKYPICEWVE